MPKLRHGAHALVGVGYRVINQQFPQFSGDPNFPASALAPDGHWIVVSGVRTRDGDEQVRIVDPLHDARRAGIPSGPMWMDVRKLRRAAGGFGSTGEGRVAAGIVWTRPPLQQPPPPQPEPDPDPDPFEDPDADDGTPEPGDEPAESGARPGPDSGVDPDDDETAD
jgi:hypothetical protein